MVLKYAGSLDSRDRNEGRAFLIDSRESHLRFFQPSSHPARENSPMVLDCSSCETARVTASSRSRPTSWQKSMVPSTLMLSLSLSKETRFNEHARIGLLGSTEYVRGRAPL